MVWMPASMVFCATTSGRSMTSSETNQAMLWIIIRPPVTGMGSDTTNYWRLLFRPYKHWLALFVLPGRHYPLYILPVAASKLLHENCRLSNRLIRQGFLLWLSHSTWVPHRSA